MPPALTARKKGTEVHKRCANSKWSTAGCRGKEGLGPIGAEVSHLGDHGSQQEMIPRRMGQ